MRQGRRHVTIERAGHFLQEDRPDEVARVIDALIN
jgi:pimeloyl-ACP methyl ester carboxylesterase